MAAVIGVLIRITAGRAVKAADVLHPLALLDARVIVRVIIVPEELAVVVVKADTDRDLTGRTHGHAVQIVGAPADRHTLGHERVVVAAGRGQRVDAGARTVRELGPNHTGDAVGDRKVSVIRNLHVVLVAIQNDCTLAVFIRAERGRAVQIAVVAHAGLVLDHRHALN